MLLSVGCRSIAASDATTANLQIIEEAIANEIEGSALALSEANREVFEAIATQQIIYLGETHTSEADHCAQLELIQALIELSQAESSQADAKQLVIGLEMFQRPFQPVLDRYLAGELSEAELIAQSEYETRWGYDWELYAPIIHYAKDHQIPLIALNTPTEVTRQVAQEGLASLSGDALIHIPPIEEIDTTDETYREATAAVFDAHGGLGHSLDFENFFAAQVLWDETMAEAVVKQIELDPSSQVIVLTGEGHIAYDYGIPSRVERRLPEVEQASVRLIAAAEEAEPGFADYFWLAE